MPKWRIALGVVLALGALPPAAHAFQPGSVLFVEPFVGVRQWVPGSQTSSLVISGPPLWDPRGVAVDHAGNVIVADRLAGTLRYTPTGAFDQNIGPAAIDVTVTQYGGVDVVNEDGDVYLLSPPYLTWLATNIPDPRGITSTDLGVVLVTSGANGGELLRVLPATGQTIVLATNLGANIERPGVDRFGNVLVPTPGRVYVLDPLTGAQRGSFASSTILDPLGVTATSGDRYFLADGDNGGECRIVEIDPIAGGATLAAPTTIGDNTPWSIATVPGGTPSPTLATGDIVLSDTGAFGGAGGIFRVNPTSGAVRALRLGGSPVALGMLRVGPTRELITAGFSVEAVNRIDPGTGRATLLADASQIGGEVSGATFDKNGDLLLAVQVGVGGRILRVERALENVTYFNVVQVAAFPNVLPLALLLPYRAPAGGPWAGNAFLLGTILGDQVPSYFEFDPIAGGAFDLGSTVSTGPLVFYEDGGALTSDGAILYDSLFQGAELVVTYWTTDGPSSSAFLSSNGFFKKITGVAVDESGNVLVADANAFGGGGGVIRVNPTNGAQTRVTTATFVDPDGIAVVPPPACSDGVDNDGDGLVDYPNDPGCLTPDDAWETVDCADGIDNDGDGNVDWDPDGWGPDPSCASAQFGMEQTQCSDGADNDGDGKIDLDDPQCTSLSGNKESPKPACGLLGIEVVGVAGWAVGRKARRKIARRSDDRV